MWRPKDFHWSEPIPLSPPFDISTFDPSTLSEEYIEHNRRDPDLCLIGQKPALEHATSRRDLVRRKTTIEVAPSVLALGKNPYSGLKQHRDIPDEDSTIPEYDYSYAWFGDSLILKYLTPAKLLELGCINTDTNIFSPISQQFRIDTEVAARASKSRTDTPLFIGNHLGIHPLVRRQMFVSTSDYEYECLKPTLRIVTKMLEMDSVLDLLWALGQRWTQVQNTKMMKDVYVYCTGRSTPQQRQDTALELVHMSRYVSFEFGDAIHQYNGYALTNPLKAPGLRGGNTTRACKVGIDGSFRHAITGGSAMLASRYNPEANDASSLLRTQLFLATTIIHELSHVFKFNTNKLPLFSPPFRNDDRMGEEGYALEAAIHRNTMFRPNNSNPSLLTSPFGLMASEWAGMLLPQFDYYEDKTRRTPQEDGLLYSTFDMVKMEYIQDFFSDEFWDERYLRYGMSSLRAVGVRYVVQNSMHTHKRNRDAITDQEEEWMPGVVEGGIVYKDKMLDYSSDKVIATKEKTLGERLLGDIAEGFVVKDVKKLSMGMKALAGKSSIKKKKKWSKKF